eukprot:gene1987-2256_t
MTGGLLSQNRSELEEVSPPPMIAALTKQSKEAAISKHAERKAKTTKEVLPTPLPTSTETQLANTTKQAGAKCRICGNPHKGHKQYDCSKNL